jgi:hypothetical protein
MKEFNYILLIIGLVAFTLLYGGHNNQLKIEYNSNFFDNLNKIVYYENKMQKFNTINNFKNNDYINIEDYIGTTQIIIPNLVDMFFIKIEPKSLYKLDKIFNLNKKEHIMIVFNHYDLNSIELCIGFDDKNVYFYKLTKKISIVSVYDIFNNSNQTLNITIFFMKRPFWYE